MCDARGLSGGGFVLCVVRFALVVRRFAAGNVGWVIHPPYALIWQHSAWTMRPPDNSDTDPI